MGLNLYAALKTSTLLIGMIQPNGVFLFVCFAFVFRSPESSHFSKK